MSTMNPVDAMNTSRIVTFWEWLTRPRLSVRLLLEQNAKLEAENRRLNDLFVQQLEANRVIPRQPEHTVSVPEPESPPRQTMAEIEAEYQENARRQYEDFLAGTRERERQLRILEGTDTEGVQ